MFAKTFRVFLLTLALCLGNLQAFSYDKAGLQGLYFGPNLSWTTMGNSGILWGQWFPQLTTAADFNWVEPLGDALPYGEKLDPKSNFLRFQAGLELSPFYENVSIGLGISPFPIRSQISFRFLYDHLVYFGSNIEMAMVSSSNDGKNGSIAENWKTKYILDNIYGEDDSSIDFSQTFTIGLDVDYLSLSGMMVGVHFNFILVDISTDFDGKSYDYQRNMPIFSRDYLLELSAYGIFPLFSCFNLVYEFDFLKSGLLKKGNTIKKESLSYGKLLVGGEFGWGQSKKHRLTITPGFFARGKERFYDGSIGEQFIIQVQYRRQFGFFDFFR